MDILSFLVPILLSSVDHSCLVGSAPESAIGKLKEEQIFPSENLVALERLRERGAAYLVLTRHQPRWWSERYKNFWSYLDSRYQRARDKEDYVVFDLGNAKRPVVSEPTSKPTAAFQPVEADDELRTQLKPRI
jgi:hypothetical protein